MIYHVNNKTTLVTIIALLVSLFAQMQAISLLGITLPLSLSSNEISTNTVGQIMALYSIGLVVGSYQGKKVIARVGHIRAFAGFGAIAIVAAIMHSLTQSVVFYALLRIVSGLSAAVMLIVIESWFNTLSQNANRSRLMALHQVIFYFAMGTGQLMINLIPGNFSATFLIAALLLCCALVPITLIRIENPALTFNTPVKLFALFKISPCGIIGAVCLGNAIGTVFNLAPIYANNMQVSTIDISFFMSAMVFSGVLLQSTIGKLADKYSREAILIVLLILTAGAAQLLLALNTLVPLPILGIVFGSAYCVFISG
ncbi:MFS transporter [Colwellia sp. MSW7]|uniref:MFS transporter n=1 Tax=Colwellia maritima TaxID=2912588 RepID=A0ABS9X597_9GAMM|nr:MFS transporter [Colwellia maritima]MCI2285412.1 MFS transporter [Colwellia maritima]